MWLQPLDESAVGSSEPIWKGLQRWKRFWDHQISTIPPNIWDRFGFFKDVALEFWSLATLMLSRGHTRISSSQSGMTLNEYGVLEAVSICHHRLKAMAESS